MPGPLYQNAPLGSEFNFGSENHPNSDTRDFIKINNINDNIENQNIKSGVRTMVILAISIGVIFICLIALPILFVVYRNYTNTINKNNNAEKKYMYMYYYCTLVSFYSTYVEICISNITITSKEKRMNIRTYKRKNTTFDLI
jgi:hypothetical protein